MTHRVAIVTAASKGIGHACAEALARDGYHAVICARTQETIHAVAKAIARTSGRTIVPVVANVGQLADLERLVATAMDRFGRIDCLVNNCGGPAAGDIHTLTDAQWLDGFTEVVLSVVRLTRLVVPIMQRQGGGRIITITSTTSRQPLPPLLVSSTLRPGLSGFARYMARELARDNILINNVLPGPVATERQQELAAIRSKQMGITPTEYTAQYTAGLPIGRMAQPEEIGNVVAFLASPAASYLTGCDIPVEGGSLVGI